MLRSLAWAALLSAALPAAAQEGSGADPGASVQTSSGDRRLGPFTPDTYPSELAYRPLTLPAGLWRVQAAAAGNWLSLVRSVELSSPLAGAYGLGDRLELGAAMALRYYPSARLSAVGAGATYLWVDGEGADLAARLEVELTQLAPYVAANAYLGLPGRLLVADGVFLTFGDRLLQLSSAPGPLGLPVNLALQVGAGFQVTSGAAILVGTDLFRALLSVAGPQGRLSIPVELGGMVALSRLLDLTVRVYTRNAFDPLLFATLSAGAALYF